MRALRPLAPLALLAGLLTACGGGGSSSGSGADVSTGDTGVAVSTTVQLRPVSARYTQDAKEGQEQLGPQTPKDLVDTMKAYDCGSAPTVLQGMLLECDASKNVYLLKAPLVSGGIASAKALPVGSSKEWYVDVVFDKSAAATLSKAADSMVGQELAIVLQGKVLTAIVIDSSMKDGSVGIVGSYTKKSATALAQALQA